MTTLNRSDKIFFSDTLREDYPEIYKELAAILSRHNIAVGILEGTYDYWCRDYMPVQVSRGEFVQFKYHPDYLKNLRRYETPTRVSAKLAREITGATVKVSSLIADGGNFTFAGIWNEEGFTPVVIMTEKIFAENSGVAKENVTEELRALFPGYKLLFLPWDREDICGHTDGIVRYLGNNRLLVNLNVYPDDIAATMRERLESCFELVDLELDFYDDDSWAYINMIQTESVIIVPGLGLPSDAQVLNQIKRLFPDYEDRVYQVPMSSVIKKYGGASNCLSWTFVD